MIETNCKTCKHVSHIMWTDESRTKAQIHCDLCSMWMTNLTPCEAYQKDSRLEE